MANKFDGDVRPLSNDRRYMGVVFTGLIDDAIQQAKNAPDHGLADQYVCHLAYLGTALLFWSTSTCCRSRRLKPNMSQASIRWRSL